MAAKRLVVPHLGVVRFMCLFRNPSPWLERNCSECPDLGFLEPGVGLDLPLHCVS